MITLSPAPVEDLELLRYWDTQQHVIDSEPDDDWVLEHKLSRDRFKNILPNPH